MEALERRISRKRSRVELKTIRTRYPMGAEKQIVQSVTRREVPPGGRAEDVRCVVFNVSAAFAVGEALNKGLPLTHRAVTVTGGAVARPRNLWVPLGTPLKELVSSAGGFREEPGLILVGGPMTGVTQKLSLIHIYCHYVRALGRPSIGTEGRAPVQGGNPWPVPCSAGYTPLPEKKIPGASR